MTSFKNSFQHDYDRLVEFTRHCREDMHEPDEQGIDAEFGPKMFTWRSVSKTQPARRSKVNFDNAFMQPPTDKDYTDMGIWLIDDTGRREWFNLAGLIALARKAVLS